MVQMPPRQGPQFRCESDSFNAGLERVKDLAYEVIGNLDADISFDSDLSSFL